VCYAYGARATARATAKEKREVTLRGGFPVLVHYGGWRCRQEAGLMNRRPACRWEAVLAPQIHCNQQPQKRERETREQKTGPGPRSFRKSDKQRLPRITYVILYGLGWALGPSAKATCKDYRALHYVRDTPARYLRKLSGGPSMGAPGLAVTSGRMSRMRS